MSHQAISSHAVVPHTILGPVPQWSELEEELQKELARASTDKESMLHVKRIRELELASTRARKDEVTQAAEAAVRDVAERDAAVLIAAQEMEAEAQRLRKLEYDLQQASKMHEAAEAKKKLAEEDAERARLREKERFAQQQTIACSLPSVELAVKRAEHDLVRVDEQLRDLEQLANVVERDSRLVAQQQQTYRSKPLSEPLQLTSLPSRHPEAQQLPRDPIVSYEEPEDAFHVPWSQRQRDSYRPIPQRTKEVPQIAASVSPSAGREEAELLVDLLKVQQDRIDELRRLLLEGDIPATSAAAAAVRGRDGRVRPFQLGPERELPSETKVVRRPPAMKLGLPPGMYDLHVHFIQQVSSALAVSHEQQPLSLRLVQAIVSPPHPSDPHHVQVKQKPPITFRNVSCRSNFSSDSSFMTFSFPFDISPPGEYHMFLLEFGTQPSDPTAWAVVCTDNIRGPRAVSMRLNPAEPLRALGDPSYAAIHGCNAVVEICPISAVPSSLVGQDLSRVAPEGEALRALHAKHPQRHEDNLTNASPFASPPVRQRQLGEESGSSLASAFPPRPPPSKYGSHAASPRQPRGVTGSTLPDVTSPRRPQFSAGRTPTKYRDLVDQCLPLSPGQQKQLDSIDEAERTRRAAHAARIEELRRRWREEQDRAAGKRSQESPIPAPPPTKWQDIPERHAEPKVIPIKRIAPPPLIQDMGSSGRFDTADLSSPLFLQVPGSSASPKSPTSMRRNSKVGNKAKPAAVEQRHSYPSASLSRTDLSPFLPSLDPPSGGASDAAPTPLGNSLNNFNSSGNFDSDDDVAASRRQSREIHEGNPLVKAPSIVLEESSPPEGNPLSNAPGHNSREPFSLERTEGSSPNLLGVARGGKGPKNKPAAVEDIDNVPPMSLSKTAADDDERPFSNDEEASRAEHSKRSARGSKEKPAVVDGPQGHGSVNLGKSDLTVPDEGSTEGNLRRRSGKGSKEKPAAVTEPQTTGSMNLGKSGLNIDDGGSSPPKDEATRIAQGEDRATNAKAIAAAVAAANKMHKRLHRDADRKRVEERRRQAAESLNAERQPILQPQPPTVAEAPEPDPELQKNVTAAGSVDEPPPPIPERERLAQLQVKALQELQQHQKRLEDQERSQMERHQRELEAQRLRRSTSVEDLRDRKRSSVSAGQGVDSPSKLSRRPSENSINSAPRQASNQPNQQDKLPLTETPNNPVNDDVGAAADAEEETRRDLVALRRKESEDRKHRTRRGVEAAEQQYNEIQQAQERRKREQDRRRQEERRREAEESERQNELRRKASSELTRKLSESKLQRKKQEEAKRQEEEAEARRLKAEQEAIEQQEAAKKPENVLARVLTRRDSSSERNASDGGLRRDSFTSTGTDGNKSSRRSSQDRRVSTGSRRDSTERRDSLPTAGGGSRRNTFTVEQMKPKYRGPTNLGRAMIKTLLEDRRRSSLVSVDEDGAPLVSRLPSPDASPA